MLVWDTPVDEARAPGRSLLGGATGQGDEHETIDDVDEKERRWAKGIRAVSAEETVPVTDGL